MLGSRIRRICFSVEAGIVADADGLVDVLPHRQFAVNKVFEIANDTDR